MGVIRSNIIHLDNVSTLVASFNWLVPRYGKPPNDMLIYWKSSASNIVLLAIGVDYDRILHCPPSRSIKRFHVKDVNALHLSKQLQALKTGRLIEICGNSANRSSGREQIFVAVDLRKGLQLRSVDRNLGLIMAVSRGSLNGRGSEGA